MTIHVPAEDFYLHSEVGIPHGLTLQPRMTAVSLFAGVGGFDLAMERNGVDVVATVEIDAAARAVLQHQFPKAHHFNDVKEVSSEQLRDAGFVPDCGIITGGFPCQDLSVAGKRAGLGGSRSGLFWEIVRLASELRPEFLILENVPGLLSSVCPCDGGGNVSATTDNERAKDNLTPSSEGAVSSDASRVTEEQWVLCSARWGNSGMGSLTEFLTLDTSESLSDAVECSLSDVLETTGQHLLRYSLSAKACQGILRRAERRGKRLPELLAQALRAVATGTTLTEMEPLSSLTPCDHIHDQEATHSETSRRSCSQCATVKRGGGKGPLISEDESLTLQTANSQVLIFGDGRRGHDQLSDAEVPTLQARMEAGGNNVPMVSVFGETGFSDYTEDELKTLTATQGKRPSEDLVVTEAFVKSKRAASETDDESWIEGEVAPTLNAMDNTGETRATVLAFSHKNGIDAQPSQDEFPTLKVGGAGQSFMNGPVVRRLTPMECERLQGFPDEWTRWKASGDAIVEQADSSRYKQMGNAVAVPVAEWVVSQLVRFSEGER